ncbi:MAG TPA: alpha/beta fold hydrolase [Solimonas sp.]|nr:alpha/beta fold hydrolase [Solimonas sp.]
MTPRTLSLRCADGVALSAREYGDGKAGSVVIAAALGVPQGFYAGFATYLAERGYRVLSYDNRGFADSATLDGAPRGREVRLADWGQQDLEAALRHAGSTGGRRFLIGHSLGTQLLGLAPAAQQLDGAILVAATAPNRRDFPAAQRAPLWLLWNALIPLLGRGRDRLPPQWIGLGAGTPMPTGAARDWARWCRSRDYLFDPAHGLDLSGYGRLRLPLRFWSFADDTLAPAAAMEALARHYPGATVERSSAEGHTRERVGHSGFFHRRQRDQLWSAAGDWLDQQGARHA